MRNNIVFKTIRTFQSQYLYDRHTNAIIRLTESEYNEISQVEDGILCSEQSPLFTKLQSKGLLLPNKVERIEHSATSIIERYLYTKIEQLILQVTQQCNLRCEYCAYSGIYRNNRTHANERMSLYNAKRAIDMYIERSVELPEVNISFYGGEPLLEFRMIKQCVDYANNLVEGRKIRFHMTTNGTLLTDDVIKYLVKNDFVLSISLDGSKEEHDINRKFANGKGSFDLIIQNIMRIKELYPEYSKQIMILTTVNPYHDLDCVLEYFSTEEILNDKFILFNNMNEMDLDTTITYDEKYYQTRNYEYIKMLFSLTGKLDTKYVSNLVLSSKQLLEKLQKKQKTHTSISPVCHHNGPCLPGVRRLFVRTDGSLFPCERTGDKLDYFIIGTLDNGFDIAHIKKLLNIGKLTEDECINCWGLRQCTMCVKQIEFEIEPSRSIKLKECNKSCIKVYNDLFELCILNEHGFNLSDDIVRLLT